MRLRIKTEGYSNYESHNLKNQIEINKKMIVQLKTEYEGYKRKLNLS